MAGEFPHDPTDPHGRCDNYPDSPSAATGFLGYGCCAPATLSGRRNTGHTFPCGVIGKEASSRQSALRRINASGEPWACVWGTSWGQGRGCVPEEDPHARGSSTPWACSDP